MRGPYNLTWHMMLDIIICITFLPVQNKYHSILYMPAFCKKRYIANQKVQEADEIKHDIWKSLV